MQVPSFPRLDEYVGVWAIEARAAGVLWDQARRMDVQAHVEQMRSAGTPGTALQSFEKVQTANGQTIAVVKACGVLMKQIPSATAGTSTIYLRRAIREAVRDSAVGGILIAVDSPGGTVSGIADLAREVRDARKHKPVWVQVEDLGASAAYQVASCAERIYANCDDALVGSIGTMLVLYDMSEQAEKAGVRTLVFKTGTIKGAGVEGAEITKEHETYFQGLVEDLQRGFDRAVQEGRGFNAKQLAAVKTGAVFAAPEALALGLIDGIQPLETTLEQLAAAVGKVAASPPAGAGGEDQTTKGGTRRRKPPGSPVEASVMGFEQWVRGQGFDPATLSSEQRAAFKRLYARRAEATEAEEEDVPAEDDAEDVPAEGEEDSSAEGDDEEDVPAEEEEGASETADPIRLSRRRLARESRRVAGIQAACQRFGSPTMMVRGRRVPVEAEAIEHGWDVPRARMAAELASTRAARPQGPGIISRSHERDCSLEALQGAMLVRFGGRLEHPAYQQQAAVALRLPAWMRTNINADQRQRAMEFAHRFSAMSPVDLCREACRLDGRDAPIHRLDLVQAALSGASLTNIFTTNVNAQMLVTYIETPDSTTGWTSSVDVADFKTQERIRLAKGGALKKLPRGVTADHTTRADSGESYRIARYATQFSVDEQDLIDDSLNALTDMPPEMGRAAQRLRPDLIYAILKANAALGADSIALFHSSHNNTDSSAALAADKLKAGITRVSVQTDNGVNLNLIPTHLIVPTTLSFTGDELLASAAIIIAGTAGSVTERGTKNTIASRGLQLVTDSRLDNGVVDPATEVSYAGDTNDWFLAAGGGHTIEVGYLRGTGRAPQVRPYMLDKGQFGIGWDVKHDLGAKAMDYRSFYRGQG
ncbi:MAG: S49 family peptidase [Gemmatimonadales bacterium]|nr:S49 family peptidase [Gemmatimonadales bacterium]